MTDHVIHHDPAVVAIVEREVRRALTEAADMLRTEAAEAWGGDSSWLTTGKPVRFLSLVDVVCSECGRDNGNGTHDALERTGHLSHRFVPAGAPIGHPSHEEASSHV